MESRIIKLRMLGWTQEEIADAVGMDHSTISKIMNFAEIGNIHKMLKEGRDVAYIAEHFFLDIPGFPTDNGLD